MALLGTGTVMDWGDNTVGELGDGTNTGPEVCLGPFGTSSDNAAPWRLRSAG